MSYFKPRRRKLGIVMLVIACLLMAGWVRSYAHFDGIQRFSTDSQSGLGSIHGQIRGFYFHSNQARIKKQEFRFPSFAVKPTDQKEFDFGENSKTIGVGDFQFHQGSGIWGHYSDLAQTPGPPVQVDLMAVRIPYWSIVIPLILLSAYLLLSKPRVKCQSQKTGSPEFR